MNRKQFLISEGATCRNWNWSWSFVNHEKHRVIFGAWDEGIVDETQLILQDHWITSPSGRKAPGYTQAIEHINLIRNSGYSLYTFKIFKLDPKSDEKGESAPIGKFCKTIVEHELLISGSDYYAIPISREAT